MTKMQKLFTDMCLKSNIFLNADPSGEQVFAVSRASILIAMEEICYINSKCQIDHCISSHLIYSVAYFILMAL